MSLTTIGMIENPLIRRSHRLVSSLVTLGLTVGSAGAMTIFIQLPTNEQLSLDVEPSDSIENVKAKIQDQRSILPGNQYLYFASGLLDDGQTLADYNIQKNSILQSQITGSVSASSFSTYPALLEMAIRDAAATDGSGWMELSYASNVDLTQLGLAEQTISLHSYAGSMQGLASGFDPGLSYSWNFLTSASGVTGFDAERFSVVTTGFTNAFTGIFSVVQSSPNSLAISYSPVPEPSSTLCGLLGLITVAAYRRRR
jgi:Ubiquitin family